MKSDELPVVCYFGQKNRIFVLHITKQESCILSPLTMFQYKVKINRGTFFQQFKVKDTKKQTTDNGKIELKIQFVTDSELITNCYENSFACTRLSDSCQSSNSNIKLFVKPNDSSSLAAEPADFSF